MDAAFSATISTEIRTETWLKLSVNAAINPLSLMKRATISDILDDEAECSRLASLIAESQAVACALGVPSPVSPEDLVAALRDFGMHKTSMLLDFELGRPLEIEPLTGAILEIAHRLGIPVPRLGRLYEEVKKINE